MDNFFGPESRRDLIRRGFSRRDFGRLAALSHRRCGLAILQRGSAGTGPLGDAEPSSRRSQDQRQRKSHGPLPRGGRGNPQNRQPGGRYLYNETFTFIAAMAEVDGVSKDHVMPFAGSSDPLHRAVLAFTGPTKSYVVADPGYEAGARAAEFIGAKTIKVPLRKDYAHDVHAMAQADPNAGLIYVCNPNNPTGSITPKEDIEYLVAHKPKDAIVLLDEAYIHLSKTAEPASAVGRSRQRRDHSADVFQALWHGRPPRRRGARAARPARQAARLRRRCAAGHRHGRCDRQPQGQGTGRTAPQDHHRHPRRDGRVARKAGIRRAAVGSEHAHDRVHRPGREVFQALLKEKVVIGRTWPSMPKHVRVSIGTREEMAKFRAAFGHVMNV